MAVHNASIDFQLSPVGEIDKEDWLGLLKDSNSPNIFYHPDMIEAFNVLSAGFRPNKLITGYADDQLALLQPVREERSSLGSTIEFCGFPAFVHLEPIARKACEPAAGLNFLSYLKRTRKPDLLIGKSLSTKFAGLLKQTFQDHSLLKVRGSQSPYLELPDTVDAFWSMYRSNFRSQLRKKLRKAQEMGISFRVVEVNRIPQGYHLSRAFENLWKLHCLRFDAINRKSSFNKAKNYLYFRRLCQINQGNYLAATFTEALHNGEVVGSFFGIRTPRRYAFLQHGFRTEYTDIGLGNALIFYTIEDLIQHKVPVFDFLRGMHDYKKRWTATFETNYDLMIPLTFRGRILMQQKLWGIHIDRKGRRKGTQAWLNSLFRQQDGLLDEIDNLDTMLG